MRVHRTFAFIDLSGFTTLTETEGDEQAVKVLSSFRTLVRDICSRRGVRIAKWLGDGAMLVSVETTPLLAGLLEMEMAVGTVIAPIAVRGGVTTGDVILHEGDDYIGHAVNVAAHICDVAKGGEVLAEPSVVADLPKWGAVLATETVPIRGLEKPLTVVRLGMRPLEGAVQPDPVCGIPLNGEVADSIARDRLGRPVLFCSESCRDTWEHRPTPLPDGQGSIRIPLIGS